MSWGESIILCALALMWIRQSNLLEAVRRIETLQSQRVLMGHQGLAGEYGNIAGNFQYASQAQKAAAGRDPKAT